MTFGKITGLLLLAAIWIWLCVILFTNGGGLTLKNIFIALASGIIIFVPLWKKFTGKIK